MLQFETNLQHMLGKTKIILEFILPILLFYGFGGSSGSANPQSSNIFASVMRCASSRLCSTTPIRWCPARVAEKTRHPPASLVNPVLIPVAPVYVVSSVLVLS